VPIPTSASFSVIVGSFSIKDNAENLIKQFNKQSIRLSIIGRNPQGLYMVGYGNFPSHDVATAERDSFRKRFIKDAWIKAN
jgi:septal ring-binding cell division protein DamX